MQERILANPISGNLGDTIVLPLAHPIDQPAQTSMTQTMQNLRVTSSGLLVRERIQLIHSGAKPILY